MSDTRTTDAGLVPFADRYRWTAGLRLAIIAASLLMWQLWPETRTGSYESLLVPAAALFTLVLVSSQLPRLGRKATFVALTTGLLLDGCYLAWTFHVLGGIEGPTGYLVVVHVMGVTLLTSFRSGLKVAMWQVLLLVCVIEAEAVGVLSGGAPEADFPTAAFGVLAFTVGAAALGTATFASGNERELRRRRYDTEVLRRFAVALETADQSETVAHRLVTLACEELLAARALVVLLPPSADGATRTAGDHTAADRGARDRSGREQTVGIAVRSDDAMGTARSVPADLPDFSAADRALSGRRTRLVPALTPETDGWVATLLPGARNVVVVPFFSEEESRGVLFLELGAGAQPSLLSRLLGAGRQARVDRRAVATVEQATAHAGLAVSRTILIRRLQAAAQLDGLTGIPNRRAFDAALTRELQLVEVDGSPCSVAFVDLDHFKRLNDTHGHQAGDEALQAAARALEQAVRPRDTVARFGGEEFCVIFGDTSADLAMELAERIRAAVADSASPVPVTASMGVACSTHTGNDPALLLRAADLALYVAKTGGRNRVADARETAATADHVDAVGAVPA